MTPCACAKRWRNAYQPPDKVVLGLLPYEDDPPDDDPELADAPNWPLYRKINTGLADLELAPHRVPPSRPRQERRLKEMSDARRPPFAAGRPRAIAASTSSAASPDFEDDSRRAAGRSRAPYA